jgi:hypothetical protein
MYTLYCTVKCQTHCKIAQSTLTHKNETSLDISQTAARSSQTQPAATRQLPAKGCCVSLRSPPRLELQFLFSLPSLHRGCQTQCVWSMCDLAGWHHACQLIFSLPSWRLLVQTMIPNPEGLRLPTSMTVLWYR